MKALLIASSLFVSFSSFAADPVTNSSGASPTLTGDVDGHPMDRTLLTKPTKPAHPCDADRKKFCGDVKPGQGAIMKCMKEHDADLSPACKAHAEDKKKEVAKRKKANADQGTSPSDSTKK